MSVATIPLPPDVARLIGSAAEFVENRSLLLDKFIFHKQWPVVEEEGRRGRSLVKWDEASRWSFLRIAEGASGILRREAEEKRKKANGKKIEEKNRERLLSEAKIAETLSSVKWDSRELNALRTRHTRHLLGLLRRAYGNRASVTIGQLEGRLAINLADSLIQNAGICLDRLFGLPYIPGSAVKGASRHAALAELNGAANDEIKDLLDAFCAVFGTSSVDFKSGDLMPFRQSRSADDADRRGAISFFPAYPVNEARVVVDLTNVHYPDYYRSGRVDDQSRENPRLNPFPVVEVGAQFAFCLVLNGIDTRPVLLEHARRWLLRALTERGVGAKTAAGYGWFSHQPGIMDEIEAIERKEQQIIFDKIEAEENEIKKTREREEKFARMSPVEQAVESLRLLSDEQFAYFAKELGSKTEAEQQAFLGLLTGDKEKRERWKTWKKKKPEVAKIIQDAAVRFNHAIP